MISLSLKAETNQRSSGIHPLIPKTDLVSASIDDPLFGSAFGLEGIPRLDRPAGDKKQEVSIFESDPYGVAAEQFRLMQRRLCNLRPNGGAVLMTSPGAGDGKSLNAHNLAWALAEAGNSTLLLELDMRRPSQSRYIPSRPPSSLVDVLTGEATAFSAVRRLGDVPMFYLGLDKPAPRPVKLLRSQALLDLMCWARQTFSWVVIDGPPVLAVSDVEELVPQVDLVLMVVRERGTPRAMLERAVDHLGERLNFLIYNDVSISSEYGYGYR
ncbi:tyrosine-protein kinase family protein [Terriglobus tenax]|uniref:tyrosine-protein kinase family protein n=1 Tax=Terriglobus tenax TaxID=1111115 RepID=UPI0021DF44E2|nr:CpsD/CapB family tyrosine-protein kinase [Terriglobus tenax]